MPGSNWRPSACKADVITTTPTDQHGGQRQNYEKYLAERGFDPRTSGLWAQHASTAPLCFIDNSIVASNISYRQVLMDDAICNYIYFCNQHLYRNADEKHNS